jgi:hypothetical protein
MFQNVAVVLYSVLVGCVYPEIEVLTHQGITRLLCTASPPDHPSYNFNICPLVGKFRE